MSKKIEIDADEFRDYYLEKKHTLKECANYFGCSTSPLRKIIKQNNLEKRSWSEEARKHFKKIRKGKVSPCKIELSKAELKRIYITENYNLEECANHFNCSRGVICSRIREYNLHKPEKLRMEKIRETSLKKYGVRSVMQTEKFKQQAKQKYLETYGVDNPAKAELVKRKIRRTCQEKYGTDNPMQNEKVKQKFRKSLPSGKTWTNQDHLSPEVVKILHDAEAMRDFVNRQENKTIVSLAKKLGVNKDTLVYRIHELRVDDCVKWLNRKSHYEEEIRLWLKSKGYEFRCSRKVLYPEYELDLYNAHRKIAIEFNGDYWHSKKEKGYHYKKSIACEKKGIRLIHIYEYEWKNPTQQAIYKNIVLSALRDSSLTPVYARKCTIEVRPSKEMKDFFSQNNIQGFRGGKFAICLVYDGEVIMSYMMGHCHFAKGKYDWEVIRGATKLGYYVIGGASRLWKFFLNEYKPKNCVYYVDFNQFNGNSVEKLGFTYLGTRLGYKNYWVKEKVVKNRNPSHHKEIKKLVEQGLVLPLWNAGVKTYVWGEPNF